VDNQASPIVITAIADSDFEGFVASTLFSQGWSVEFRALSSEALIEHIHSKDCSKTILIFSPDLPGISQEILNLIKPLLHRVLGFNTASGESRNLFDVSMRPKGPLDLLEAIRGNIRAPMVRSNQVPATSSKRARIIAFGSLGHGVGCTTLAINYSFEIAHLGKKVLLIDANYSAPAIAILLAQRNLNSVESWKHMSENVYGAEVTHENLDIVSADLGSAIQEFDFIIVDLGSISELANILIDRRWNSQIAMWCCNSGDQILIVSGPGILLQHRLRKFILTLNKISISAQIGYIFNGKIKNRKGESEEELFMATVTPLRPTTVYVLPSDLRGVLHARNEQKPLGEVNERGSLRKSIALIASEIVG
jgi:Mrp family chromosome partitioning ATPase